MSDEDKADYYSELTDIQKKILEKELEVESIADRVTILTKTEWVVTTYIRLTSNTVLKSLG